MRFSWILMLMLVTGTAQAQDRLYTDEFPLGDVTLLDGPLKKARDLNISVLMKYDNDRLLAPYLKEAGLTPKGKSYPNWDGLDGHVGGHYLTALAINAATGSKECQQRLDYWISELQACADANAKNHPEWGKGYVGGVPGSDRIWSAFKKGDFGPYQGAWVPFYNLHKMYAGLRDAWVYCGNEQAKTLFLGFCDWAIELTAGLSDAQMERALDTEHGGMNEVLADAYAITGEQKYLDVARRFSHRRLLNPLMQRRDILDNMHANTQVPKVVGFERIAELAGDEAYHTAGAYFWDIVTGERSLAFGRICTAVILRHAMPTSSSWPPSIISSPPSILSMAATCISHRLVHAIIATTLLLTRPCGAVWVQVWRIMVSTVSLSIPMWVMPFM